MSNNKHNKVLFCRFYSPAVEVLAIWDDKYFKHAQKCVKLHNDTVIGPNGDFDNEFWFLNKKIGGETKIITSDKQGEFPSNDPQIVAKLEAYIASLDCEERGSAKNRGINKQFNTKNRFK